MKMPGPSRNARFTVSAHRERNGPASKKPPRIFLLGFVEAARFGAGRFFFHLENPDSLPSHMSLPREDARSVPKYAGRTGRYKTARHISVGFCRGRPLSGRAGFSFISETLIHYPHICHCLGKMPGPSRNSRGGPAATKPSAILVLGFVEAARLWGGQTFVSSRTTRFTTGPYVIASGSSIYGSNGVSRISPSCHIGFSFAEERHELR
jgi:hypothetical protein